MLIYIYIYITFSIFIFHPLIIQTITLFTVVFFSNRDTLTNTIEARRPPDIPVP